MDYNQFNPYDDARDTETVYVSKRNTYSKSFLKNGDGVDKVRYVEEILSSAPVCGLLKEKDKTILHITSGGKQKIKATVYEDPNRVTVLHIARLNKETGNPFTAWQACFYGKQLKLLYNFLSKILSIDYSNPDKFKVSQPELEKLPNKTQNLFETIAPVLEINRNKSLTGEEVSSLVTFLTSHHDFWTKAQENGLNIEDIYYSLSVKKRKKIIEEFQNRLNNMNEYQEDKGNNNWQHWFLDKKWMFGNDISEILDKRRSDHANIYDYLTESYDGFVDLIEIKDPKIKFWSERKDHNNYIPSSELVKAIIQCANYIHNLELRSNDKNTSRQLGDILKPRCTLVIGRSFDWTEEHYESFRILNSSYHNISIITYDMLLKRAKNMYDINDIQENTSKDIYDGISF